MLLRKDLEQKLKETKDYIKSREKGTKAKDLFLKTLTARSAIGASFMTDRAKRRDKGRKEGQRLQLAPMVAHLPPSTARLSAVSHTSTTTKPRNLSLF